MIVSINDTNITMFCHNDECRVLFTVMPKIFILSVVAPFFRQESVDVGLLSKNHCLLLKKTLLCRPLTCQERSYLFHFFTCGVSSRFDVVVDVDNVRAAQTGGTKEYFLLTCGIE